MNVNDRVRHVNGSRLQGIVKRIYQPLGANELWADVLWLGSTRGNAVHPARDGRNKLGQIRMSALKLV